MRRILSTGALVALLGLAACHTGGNYLRSNPDLPSNGYPFYALQQSTHATLYPPHGGAVAATYVKHDDGTITFTPYERYFYIPAYGPNRERHLTGASGADNISASVVSRAATPTYRSGTVSHGATATARAPTVTTTRTASSMMGRRPPAPRTFSTSAGASTTTGMHASSSHRVVTVPITNGESIRTAQWVERKIDGKAVLVREYETGSGRAREVVPVHGNRVVLPPPRPEGPPPGRVYAR